jgi:hypothetical protein
MHDLGRLTPVVSVVMLFGIPIVALICSYGYEAWKTWLEISLKRDMVARGYTAQEILEVLGGGKGNRAASWLPNVPPAKPVKEPVASI